MSGEDWSEAEVRAIVDDYLAMLALELANQPYSKKHHRESLVPKLEGRSPSAVEWKHRNISAVLEDIGFRPIQGYKAAHNRQELLVEVLRDRIASDRRLQELASAEADRPVVVPEVEDILGILEEPPGEQPPPTQPPRGWIGPPPIPIDYRAREAQNRSLGAAGEEFVLRFERARLAHAGRVELAERIVHTSRVRGDHAGYDIQSYELDGAERLIEVKTTNYGERVPFFVSRNEVEVSAARASQYHVYRLHSFRHAPRLFMLSGAIASTCVLDAASFVARVRHGRPASAG